MQLTPDGLAKLYNMPVEATMDSMRLNNQMMQSGELANQAQGIENLYKSQNNPLLVEQTKLENQSKQARIPGEAAQSRSFGFKADREAATQGDAIAAARAKFVADASDADISMLENRAQKMAYSMDPNERAQGEQLIRMHKDIIRDREKQDAQLKRQIQLSRVNGEEARKTQGQAIEAGKYTRSGKGGGGGLADVDAAAQSGKLGFEKAATAYASAAQQAMQAGDQEEAARLFSIANQYNQMYIQGRQAGAAATQAGKLDMGANTGMPTVPLRPVQPFQAPGQQPTQAPAPAATPDAGMFQKAFGGYEPNKYDYRIGPNGVPQRKLKGS
jgi:hypothetical protein